MVMFEIEFRWRVLTLAGVVFVAIGCGSAPRTQETQPPTKPPVAQPAEEDPELLSNLSIADQSANEMVVPEEKASEGAELLAGNVQSTRADYRRPFLATVRVEHGGKVTTGSIIHCSPKFGVYILTCRHGREVGGPWVVRCSGGALIYGEKYVTSKNSDLCLLKAPGQYDLGHARPVSVRIESVAKPETCLSVGYDSPLGGGKFATSPGDSPRAWADDNIVDRIKSQDGYPLISATVPSGPGRSGGGLFMMSTSELVGVCSFKDGLGVHFVGRRSVLSFLNRCHELGHVPWWTKAEIPAPSIRPFPDLIPPESR